MPLETLEDVQARLRLVSQLYSKPNAEKAAVYASLIQELGMDPNTIAGFKGLDDRLRERLKMEENRLFVREKGFEVGGRVQTCSNPPEVGTITKVRKDWCLQVRLDTGKSVGLRPGYLKRLV